MSQIFKCTNCVRGVLLLMLIVGGLAFFGQPAAAQTLPAQPAPAGLPGTSFDLDGYLWSSTIGWVSLNCRTGGATGNNVCGTSNYKVTVSSATGNMTGYAWSSNIGWIRFGGLSGFPVPKGNTAGNAMMSGSYNSMTLYGWVRACAGTNSPAGTCSSMGNNPSSGSWDGWISLRGTSPNYGITTNKTKTVSAGVASTSFAWGSTIVGWIGFDIIRLLLPTATFSGTGCTIATGSSTCAGSLSWVFSTDPIVPSKNIKQTSPATVLNIGGVVPSNVDTVSVDLAYGANVYRAFSATNELSLISLSAACNAPNKFFIPPGICDQLPPTVTITTSKDLIRSGETVTVTWTITPPVPAATLSPNTSCRVYGPGMPSGVQAVPGSSAVSLPISNATEFSVICNGTFSASMGPATLSKSVEVVPVSQEI